MTGTAVYLAAACAFAAAWVSAAPVDRSRPGPLGREAIWADLSAETVFRGDFSAGTGDVALAPIRPAPFPGLRFQGVVERAGPAGENALAVDFDILAQGNQRFKIALPRTRAYGLHFRFLLKIAPAEAGRETDLAMELNKSHPPLHTIHHAEPLETKVVKTGEWLEETTQRYWRGHLERVHPGWVRYEGDTASYPLRSLLHKAPPQEYFDGLEIVVVNRGDAPVSLRVSVAGILVIRRDVLNLPEVKAVMEAKRPVIEYTAAQIALAKKRLAAEPAKYAAPGWLSARLKKADAWAARTEPFAVRKVQAGWPGGFYCEDPKCRGRLQPDPPSGYACPKCKRKYTGEQWDRLLAYVEHEEAGAAAAALGFAWQWTGEERYARKAAEILLAYAAAIPDFPLGHNWLGDCWLMENFLLGYDYTYEWLPAESRKKIDEDFLMAMVKRIYHYNHHYPEGQIRIQRVCGWAALLAKDPVWVPYILFSLTGNRGVSLRYGLTDDMVSLKGPAYHGDIVRGFNAIGTTMENCGVAYFDGTMKGVYDAVPRQIMPDGSLPALGHTNVGYRAQAYGMETAYRYYRDPVYLALLSEDFVKNAGNRLFWEDPDLPAAAPLRQVSSNMAALGLTVLRSRPDNASALALSWGAAKRNDPGRLDFHFYGAGGHLVWSSGTAGYANPYYGPWYQSSLSRNVPVLNESSQQSAAAPQIHYGESGGVQAVSAGLSGAYPGTVLVRTAFLFDEGDAMILDVVSALKKSSIDWTIHLPGVVETDAPLTETSFPFGRENGYQVLAESPVLTAAAGLQEILLKHSKGQPARGVRVRTASTEKSVFHLCVGRTGTGADPSKVGIFRHDAVTSLAFACMMQPFGGQPPARGGARFIKADPGSGAGPCVLEVEAETAVHLYRIRMEIADLTAGRPSMKALSVRRIR